MEQKRSERRDGYDIRGAMSMYVLSVGPGDRTEPEFVSRFVRVLCIYGQLGSQSSIIIYHVFSPHWLNDIPKSGEASIVRVG